MVPIAKKILQKMCEECRVSHCMRSCSGVGSWKCSRCSYINMNPRIARVMLARDPKMK